MIGNNQSFNKVYFLNMKTKKEEKPHFRVVDATDDEKHIDMPDATFVEGRLAGIEPTKWKYEGEVMYQARMRIVDDTMNEMYMVTIPYSMVGRSILNCLASQDKIGKIRISLYTSKNSGYASAYVTNDGEQCDWQYSIDAMRSKIAESKVGKKVVRDYSELDEFFDKVITEIIAKRLFAAPPTELPDDKTDIQQAAESKNEKIVKEDEKTKEEPEELPPDDLPF